MGLSGPLIFVALFLSEKVGLGIAFPGVLDEPALMSTANLFRLAQRRLSAGPNPFEGKLFYVNPSYRRPQLDTVGRWIGPIGAIGALGAIGAMVSC